jgi:hypothetical protein
MRRAFTDIGRNTLPAALYYQSGLYYPLEPHPLVAAGFALLCK